MTRVCNAKGRRGVAIAAALTALLVAASASPAAPAHRRPRHLYVSPHGRDQGGCTRRHPCRTIGHAVAVARAGDEIDVAAGSYSEGVTVTKRLTIAGSHAPVIVAQGRAHGILIRGSGGAGSVVRGLVIRGATYEGILALRTRDVTIANNVVRNNDQGYFARHLTGECTENGQPGVAHTSDLRAGGCGEAIHLASTSGSRVTGNLVTGNTGGIYLTDESGPAAHNLIAHNQVVGNQYDCGVTLASHSYHAVSDRGRVRPRVGGVYDNTILDNVANFNGLRNPGAGILVAAAFFGSAAYDNRIIGNTANGNGLPGITLHSHAPRQDLDGNVIQDNLVGRNALGGPTGGPGDGDGGVKHTTGILVWSAQTQIAGTRVTGNHISYDYFGIWTKHVPRMRPGANGYRHVRVPLRQYKTG
jgi:parallel beta-helix repeat protein